MFKVKRIVWGLKVWESEVGREVLGELWKKGVNLKQIAIQMILSLSDPKLCADSESKKFAAQALSQNLASEVEAKNVDWINTSKCD